MVSNCFEGHGRYAYKNHLLRAQSALNKAVDKVPIDRTKGLSMGTLSIACGNPDGIAAFETMKMKYLPCGKCEIMPFGHCKMFRLCGIQSTFSLVCQSWCLYWNWLYRSIYFFSSFKCCIKQIEVSTEMLTPIRFRRISAFSCSQLCNKGGKEFFVVGYYAIVGIVEKGRILGLVDCHDAL